MANALLHLILAAALGAEPGPPADAPDPAEADAPAAVDSGPAAPAEVGAAAAAPPAGKSPSAGEPRPAAPPAPASPSESTPPTPSPAVPAPVPPAAPPAPEPAAPISCRVLYETIEGYYVNIGEEAGVTVGAQGWLRRAGAPIARVEVMTVSRQAALLKAVGDRVSGAPVTGEGFTLILDRLVTKQTSPAPNPSPTLKNQMEEGGVFVPLLGTPDLGKEGVTEVKNLFHGRLSFSQLFQFTSGGDHDAYRTRVGFSGNVERIEATPWDLEWSTDLFYRDGDGFSRAYDYQEVRLETYRFNLFRRFDQGGFVRIGRFLPLELPSVGYLDGAQAEKVIDSHWRVGGMFGFKPDRNHLRISLEEPTAVGYGTFGAGEAGKVLYSGTAGILMSLFNGSFDRLAFLLEQRFEAGRFTFSSGSEVDFDAGATETHSGTQLTRLDLIASYSFSPLLLLRAGLDRWELPDTEAERDAINEGFLNREEFFDRGYNRYWVGASHDLPAKLILSEEASLTDSSFESYVPRFTVNLTRVGLPSIPDGSVTVSVFLLRGQRTEGYGGRVSALVPLLRHRLSLLPAVGYRQARFSSDSDLRGFDNFTEDLQVIDFSLRAHCVISKAWSGSAGIQYISSDDSAFLVDVSVSYQW